MFHRCRILRRVRCRWGGSGCDRLRALSIPHPLLAQRVGHPAYAALKWNCFLIQTGSGAHRFDDSMLVIVMIVSLMVVIVVIMSAVFFCDRFIHCAVCFCCGRRWSVCVTVSVGGTVVVQMRRF